MAILPKPPHKQSRGPSLNELEGYLFFCFWLLGFLASRASWLFGFLAFLALAFRILCIPRPSSSSAGGVLAFAAFRPFIGFWSQHHQFLPKYLNHLFFEHHGGASRYFLDCLHYLNHHFFEHYGGGCRPPQPPATF